MKLAEIDPVYFESSYYVAPESTGERAYALLFAALAVGVSTEWTGLMDLDDIGRDLQGWADDQDGLHGVLRVIEVAFNGPAIAVD